MRDPSLFLLEAAGCRIARLRRGAAHSPPARLQLSGAGEMALSGDDAVKKAAELFEQGYS